ncbi:MAG: LysM peptidoglycan-binding domain-containing protein [Tyzzerella sp.]|nr:LysM peptidoglycan-binding domain-containing protein [Tyzzerella sp.]
MKRQLPKNVRQIGNVSDSSKIYVEDYVDTFFNQLCDKAEQEMIGAFLVGETVQEEDQDYIYVYGAIRMKELVVKGKDFVVGEHVWKHACETCKEYFGNAEILGWFITGGEHPLEVNHNINKIHQKYFPREKSIFVTKNARDKEEKFYIYKYRDMMECSGHYVYYEKNVEMQNYMIATRKKVGFTPSEIIEDRVTKNFRSMIREKNEKAEQKNHSRLVYAMSTFLVLVIVVIGVTMLNNYDKMQNVQNSIDVLSGEESKKDEDKTVEALGDNVTSLIDKEEETDTETDQTETQETEPEKTQPEETQPEEGQAEGTQSDDKKTETTIITAPKTYIVKKGDTLETISRETYGDVSHVDAICELNGLDDGNFIFIGQKLLLP